MSFLQGESLYGGYGGADILQGCSVGVNKGEIAVVVGPNGAGKSTAMKAMFGMLSVREGSVELDGQDISKLPPSGTGDPGHGFRSPECECLHLHDRRGES